MSKYKINEEVVSNPGYSNSYKYTVTRDARVVAEFERNYSGHCHILIEQDGCDWILCSENYHGGMTAINLTTGDRGRYDPVGESQYDQFWCLAGIDDYDPDDKTLTVDGCYWSAPFERKVFDVSDPLTLPWPELSCVELD